LRKPIIGVIGAGQCTFEVASLAEEVGREIARKGGLLLCGGLGGVMEAASKGAKEEGGITIGILPGNDPGEANRYIDIPIVTGLNHARNVLIARSSDILIAISGGYGTLSEIAFGLLLNKKIISLGSWELAPDLVREGIITATTSREAVAKAFRILSGD
jgi:uncharacterized protein (TIGR00725 family)